MKNLFFKELNLSKPVQDAIERMGFEEATPIQSNSIPVILEGKDVVGQAQTGTGKTCAFAIPAVEKVDANDKNIQVLVISPTRELALQIAEETKNVSYFKEGVKILPVYGGQQIERQILALKKKPQIIIGTPGRIMDHIRRKTIKLNALKMVILDEADEMLNMGFREDIDTILEKVPNEKQTLLFSATIAKPIMDITTKYLKDPVYIKTIHKELTVPNIEQYYIETKKGTKLELLSRLIEVNDLKLGIVFCNTKKQVDELVEQLCLRGYNASGLHGDMKQSARDNVMTKFRKGTVEILVATDVAARGIDVDNIDVVFNYDIPNDEEYYVHRIGRTGRTGRNGKAYTFVCGKEIYKLKDIQKYTKSKIVQQKAPSLDTIEEKRINEVMKQVSTILESNNYSRFIPHIERLLEKEDAFKKDTDQYTTSIDLCATFLKLLVDQNTTSLEEINLDTTTFEGNSPKEETTRLFINVGSKDNVQPEDILQAICTAANISKKCVGKIKILSTFSFIEVPSEYTKNVIKLVRNSKIKGRKVNIEKANTQERKRNN